MKRSDYFYSVLLLGILAVIGYGFFNFFWIMAGLITFSCVFSFAVFLFQTKINPPVADADYADEPIDFYKTEPNRTYYKASYYDNYQAEQLKQANGE